MTINSLNVLEEKIQNLLHLVTDLRTENEKLKTDLDEGTVMVLETSRNKHQRIREKVKNMLVILEEF